MTNRAGLTGKAGTLDGGHHIELAQPVGDLERLGEHHA